MGGVISHDQIIRFLAGEKPNGKSLRLKIKMSVRQYESGEDCLVFDDTTEEGEGTGGQAKRAGRGQRCGRR
jgi:hypothetical protein